MAGKHVGADEASLGPNYIPGGKIDRAYAEGRLAGRDGALTGVATTETPSTTVMTDSGADFTVDALIGGFITNTTNGGIGLITDNDGTTVTSSALSGSNNWEADDGYHITPVANTANPHDGSGSEAETAWDNGHFYAGTASRKYECAD